MDRITQPQRLNRNRRVMIGTPCYDGKIEVWYANSLVETIKQSPSYNMDIFPIWLSYDALIQRARNDLIALMLEMDCDDIIFIDSDISWQPEWFFRLLNYPVDVVGGTYPKKGDDEMYPVKHLEISKNPNTDTGLLEVDGLGTGFLKMSRRAIEYLWNNSAVYAEKEYGKVRRMVFDVVIKDEGMISEDIWVCMKLKQGGFPIWLDTTITCDHVGIKKYTGNFNTYWKKLRENFQSNYGTVDNTQYSDISKELEKIRTLYGQ